MRHVASSPTLYNVELWPRASSAYPEIETSKLMLLYIHIYMYVWSERDVHCTSAF